MEPRQSLAQYRNHSYSGRRCNRKRSLGQIKRYHGEGKSRQAILRKKIKTDDNVPTSSVSNTSLKTYTRTKKVSLEASLLEPVKQTEEIATTASPFEIIWSIDDAVVSHDLKIEPVPQDPLAGLAGNRIVDVSHVLQWAFKLEKHKSQCDGSNILYVSELRNGFNSIFVFKCSMCNTEFRHSNEPIPKINDAFVRGTVTAGSYYTQAAQITNTMGIPTMSGMKFLNSKEKFVTLTTHH